MRTNFIISSLTIFMSVAIPSQSTNAQVAGNTKLEELKTSYSRPDHIEFPKDAPYSPQMATLGKLLFFDPRLSKAQNMSCATCHNPSFGWETPVAKAIGGLNIPLKRHAPTVLNLADAPLLNWDGRAKTLEEQAEGPLTHPAEMANNMDDLIIRLSKISSYKKWFNEVFPDEGINRENLLKAIATYERTIQSGLAPFDRWIDGDEEAISEEAKLGFTLFNGKAKCSNCHLGWSFTNHSMQDIGIPTDDIGYGEFEPQNTKSYFVFKTPGLRNISARAPYMHNGSIENLDSIIEHYVSGGIERPSKSPYVEQFSVSNQERAALIAFLETLTEENLNVPTPTLPSR